MDRNWHLVGLQFHAAFATVVTYYNLQSENIVGRLHPEIPKPKIEIE